MLKSRFAKSHIGLVLIASIFSFSFCGSSVLAKTKPRAEEAHSTQKRLKVKAMTSYEGAWVANFETDVYQAGTFENISFGYSTKNGWDVSLSLLNVQIIGNHNRFQGEPFINLAKTFVVNQAYSVTLGSLNGMMVASTQPNSWMNFSFLDNSYDIMPWLNLHGGPYLANAAITTTVRQVGFLTGIEIGIIPDKLALHMDYISGHHALSGANVNMLYNLSPLCQIYLGVLVPEQNSGNEFAGVLGFNLSSHQL